ncbi:MAG: hypothetical protein ACREFR_17935 [Limisphaerales bacterium]
MKRAAMREGFIGATRATGALDRQLGMAPPDDSDLGRPAFFTTHKNYEN